MSKKRITNPHAITAKSAPNSRNFRLGTPEMPHRIPLTYKAENDIIKGDYKVKKQ
jgi:hypothetical protein